MTRQDDCLDEASVLDFVQGNLREGERAAAEHHLASCSECRELVSALAQSSLALPGISDPRGRTLAFGSDAASFPNGDRSIAQPAARGNKRAPVMIGEVLANKYAVERVLGMGGMGVVVAARHLELGTNVALKFLLPDAFDSADAVTRFRHEARAAARIRSEHVARVLDFGTLPSGAPFMVMELLTGEDFAQLLTRAGALKINETIEYVLQACEAIAEAHSLGIVHRDLKPANLFLAMRADGSPLVKVLDFGISKAMGNGAFAITDAGLTTRETRLGSPRYMSPEQIRSPREVDARTDVWAIGIILYELLTATPAFEGESIGGLCTEIAITPAPKLRAKVPHAPEHLENVILQCLEKSPANRLASVAAIAEALRELAPPTSRLSIDRIVRLAQGQGSIPPSATPAPSVAETRDATPLAMEQLAAKIPAMTSTTGGGFGRTGPDSLRSVGRAGAGWAVAIVIAVSTAAWFAFHSPQTGATSHDIDRSAASAAASDHPIVPITTTPSVATTPTPIIAPITSSSAPIAPSVVAPLAPVSRHVANAPQLSHSTAKPRSPNDVDPSDHVLLDRK